MEDNRMNDSVLLAMRMMQDMRDGRLVSYIGDFEEAAKFFKDLIYIDDDEELELEYVSLAGPDWEFYHGPYKVTLCGERVQVDKMVDDKGHYYSIEDDIVYVSPQFFKEMRELGCEETEFVRVDIWGDECDRIGSIAFKVDDDGKYWGFCYEEDSESAYFTVDCTMHYPVDEEYVAGLAGSIITSLGED